MWSRFCGQVSEQKPRVPVYIFDSTSTFENEYDDENDESRSTSAPKNSSDNHFRGNLAALASAVNRHAMGGCS
jgi:hypothetical protein